MSSKPPSRADSQKAVNRALSGRGCYTLVITLPNRSWIQIGRLARARVPQGTYLYTGSALNGLRGRLARHLRKISKRNYWHIDYLMQAPQARVRKVLIYPGLARLECVRNQRIASLRGAKVIVNGFGASDCTSKCPSHLFYFRKAPTLKGLPLRHHALIWNCSLR